ncbi:MAG: hypothetical protein Q4G68_01115 [Planctomycetia bacterium]|nr:hypothetical protein [Planctomycetia bacterium]
MRLRITKYDPANRDQQGHYTKNDWISIGDIGNSYDGKIFTAADYFAMEDAYCESVKLLLQAQKIDHLFISRYSRTVSIPSFFTSTKFYNMRDELIRPLHLSQSWNAIEIMIRLTLREEFWCSFKGKYGTYLHFGYGFYMFYGSKRSVDLSTINFPKCIFIEENFPSPYLSAE